MSASQEDSIERMNSKRKHGDDETPSRRPPKKSKANDVKADNYGVRSATQKTPDTAQVGGKDSTSARSGSRKRKEDIKEESIQSDERASLDAAHDAKKADRKQRKKERKAAARLEAQRAQNGITQPEQGGHVERINHEKRPSKERASKKGKAKDRYTNGPSTQILSQSTLEIANPNTKSSFPNWSLSPTTSGRFLPHDPIFLRLDTGDEYILTATRHETQILSLQNSLVFRTHPAPAGKSILCYTLDTLNKSLVYIGYNDGSIERWDWTKGSKAAKKEKNKADGRLIQLAWVPPMDDEKAAVLYLSDLGNRSAILNLDDNLLLHMTTHRLESMLILGQGEFIVCHGRRALVLGKRKAGSKSTSDFIWIEIPLATEITCFDARINAPPSSDGEKDTAKQTPSLALAIGNTKGEIHLYPSITSLFQHSSSSRPITLPTPRILHWHREAVSSLKFSRDGKYIISGGNETVLVLWQLETGKRQYLPHLTAVIERVVVSPEGDKYAVQMGDNSILVLSTSELKAVAVWAGLQMAPKTSYFNLEANDTKMLAAALHPTQAHQLLLTVPASSSDNHQSQHPSLPRPFLQTFNTLTARHTARQALTRTNITDFNLSPEDTPILPPDVAFLAVSQNGQWMATAEEWMPTNGDVAHLHADDEDGKDVQETSEKRREVYLKIWRWDEGEGLWTLETRVDAPHGRGDGMSGAGRILALVADPARNAFATAGEDYCVRIWTPKSGSKKKRDQGVDVVEWTCKRTTHLPRPAATFPERAEYLDSSLAAGSACLTYSDDGSLLAATFNPLLSESTYGVGNSSNDIAALALADANPPVVYFISTRDGTIAAEKSGIARAEIAACMFLGRYFVAVERPTPREAGAAYIWDLVADVVVDKFSLLSSSSSSRGARRLVQTPMLAVDSAAGTFALVCGGKRVEIFTVLQDRVECVYRQQFEEGIEALLSGGGKEKGRSGMRGYCLIFADATVRMLSPAGGSSSLQHKIPAKAEVAAAITAIEGGDAIEEVASSEDTRALVRKNTEDSIGVRERQEEDDRPVVRPEQLAGIFDVGPSYAMPGVKDMFQAVVGLFGRKSVVEAEA